MADTSQLTAWETWGDPLAMLEIAAREASDRRLRLLAAAFCRRLPEEEAIRWAVAMGMADRFALGLPLLPDDNDAPLWAEWYARTATDVLDVHNHEAHSAHEQAEANSTEAHAAYAVALLTGNDLRTWIRDLATAVVDAIVARAIEDAEDNASIDQVDEEALRSAEAAAQADLVRCVLCDPARPLSARSFPAHVVALARECHDTLPTVSDRFGVLADALEDLSELEAAAHCRCAVHSRGCHVLDWALGRE